MSDISDCFRRMADLIDHNKDGAFAGAYVIVPPPFGQGQELFPPIEVLTLDTTQSPVQFLQTLQSKVATALAHIERLEQQAGGFGRR